MVSTYSIRICSSIILIISVMESILYFIFLYSVKIPKCLSGHTIRARFIVSSACVRIFGFLILILPVIIEFISRGANHLSVIMA